MCGTKHIKKHLLESGRNNAMKVVTQIISNLLLKVHNMSEMQFFCQLFCRFSEILKKLSDFFYHTEYLHKD